MEDLPTCVPMQKQLARSGLLYKSQVLIGATEFSIEKSETVFSIFEI